MQENRRNRKVGTHKAVKKRLKEVKKLFRQGEGACRIAGHYKGMGLST